MCGAELLRLSPRMERVAEAQQAGDPAGTMSSSATMAATRPPIDLPPMISFPGASSASIAARYSGASVSALGGGLRAPERLAAM